MAETGQLKIVFAEVEVWEREFIDEQIEELAWQIDMYDVPAEELPTDVKASLQVLSCFIESQIDETFLDACPNLKLVTTRSTGVDHIDLEACDRHGVTVCNVAQYGENTVAEHTFGLMLTLSRHLHQAIERVKRSETSIEGLLGFDLYGKTLGVIGAGHIGLHVIRMGRALSMRTLVYDVEPRRILAEVLQFEYTDLDSLLQKSDVVTIHVPLVPATYHLLNAEKLALMKSTAILVNTARGAIIDSGALLKALNEDRIAGAALDVLEAERVITEDDILRHPEEPSLDELRLVVEAYQLMRHPRVIVTPHIAFYSREALQRLQQTTFDNIRAFAAGEPRNTVTVPPS
jgi:D-lactate dehydrogenase